MENSRTHKASLSCCPMSPPSNFPSSTLNSEVAKFLPSVVASLSGSTGFGRFGQRPSSNTGQQPPGFPGFGSHSSSSGANGVTYPRNFGTVLGPSPTQGVQKEQDGLLSSSGRDLGEKVTNSDDGDLEFTLVDPDVNDNCDDEDDEDYDDEDDDEEDDDDDDDELPEIGLTDKTDPKSELKETIRRRNSNISDIDAYRVYKTFLDSAPKLSDNSSSAQNTAITANLALETNGKNGSENKRNRDESSETDNESRKREMEDVDISSSPASKRTKTSVQQNPRCEYHFTSPRNSDSTLPIVHAVISTRRYRRNGTQRYRLEKLFLDQKAATVYAEEWTWAKFSKYEDDVQRDDLDVLGENEEIGYYTPRAWNESSGMSFGAFMQRRVLE
jgi:hypothetical protein